MTGARTLQGRLGGKIAIGAAITKVQAHWRDKELTLPMLLLAAMQVIIRGGELPAAESSGNAYLKIPLNVF